MDTTIYSKGLPIPRLNDSKHFFHNRLTLIIGPSGSGKSALTQHILNSLRDVIPLIMVACPTAALNGDYNGVAPEQCIYDDLTKTLIQKIFQRQQGVVEMHQLVNDAKHLKSIFKMVATDEYKEKLNKLDSIYIKGCRDVKTKLDESEVDATLTALKETYEKKCVKHMRKCINENIDSINISSLSEIQQSIVKNFNINPSLVLIVDDCMATVKEWSQLSETKKLFFQGRHYHLTTIMLCQNTTLLSPQFRTNAHITIFTTGPSAIPYFKKDTSGFSPDERKELTQKAVTIFTPSNNEKKPNYKKMVLMGDIIKTDYKVQYIIGTPKKKRFGSSAMWRLCDVVKKDNEGSSSMTFNKMFSIKPKQQLSPPVI